MREEEGFEEKYERIIRENFRADFQAIQCFKAEKSAAKTDESAWGKLKRTLYKELNDHVKKEFLDYIEIEAQANPRERHMFPSLMGKIKSISELLRTFPQLL